MPLAPKIGENQIILQKILARRDQNGEFPIQRLFGNFMEGRAKAKIGILNRLIPATGKTEEPPKAISVAEDRFKSVSKYAISV